MNVRNLYEMYRQGIGVERSIILCDYKKGDGYRIESIEAFDSIMDELGDDELYLLNKFENSEFVYFDFFKLSRATPSVAVIRHPYLANAYWKEKPDHIIDIANIGEYMYRYISVDYGELKKELIIELPTTIDDEVFKLLKKRFPDAFYNNVKGTSASYSLVFGNTDRFEDNNDQLGYRTFKLDEIYGDKLKKPTIKVVSNKFWNELKALAN